MWVWQSQAPAGTSNFTGVEGCAGIASALRFCTATPAAIEASRRSRLLSIWVVSSVQTLVLFRGSSSCVGSCDSRGVAGGSSGEESDDGGHQRTSRQEKQAGLEAVGGILDPADDERTEITPEIADGVDLGDGAGCRRAREKKRRHRPERGARAIDARGCGGHAEQRPPGSPRPGGESKAEGAKRRSRDQVPASLLVAVRRPAPCDQA